MLSRKPVYMNLFGAKPIQPKKPMAPKKPITPKKPIAPKKPSPPNKPKQYITAPIKLNDDDVLKIAAAITGQQLNDHPVKIYYIYNPLITIWDIKSKDILYEVIISTKAPKDCPILGNIVFEYINGIYLAHNNLLYMSLLDEVKKRINDHANNENTELTFVSCIKLS